MMDWFEFKAMMDSGFGIFIIFCIMMFSLMGIVIYIEFMPLKDKCPMISTITDKQILTNEEKCIVFYTEQGYLLQNNTLNGKYVLNR